MKALEAKYTGLRFMVGTLFGVVISLVVMLLRRKQDVEALINGAKESFSEVSLVALSRTTEEFFKIANERFAMQQQIGDQQLEGKKELIDQTLATMKEELQSVKNLVTSLENDRHQKYGELANQLRQAAEQTTRLQETTGKLQIALSNTNVRGQWGEKMAEDIFQAFGFIEGINYHKQKVSETSATRPDYTLLLPQGLTVNMDVKFPITNYLRYCDCTSDVERTKYKEQFFKDVRGRVREITTRSYISPEDNTVDYVIMFIPNEQVYGFIYEHNHTIFFDEALKSKVIVCSPLTLYAILSVVRQAVDNFNLERTASQILTLMSSFNKQWGMFIESFDKLGKRIEDTEKEYNTLLNTRRNQLEKQLKKIDDLREEQGIPDELPDGN